MNNNDNLSALEYLLKTLGLKETIELVELALPAIESWQLSFSEPSSHNDPSVAAVYAHKALGSVRLYGTKRLEGLLIQVKDRQLDAIERKRVLKEICDEFHSTREFLKKWLSAQNANDQC